MIIHLPFFTFQVISLIFQIFTDLLLFFIKKIFYFSIYNLTLLDNKFSRFLSYLKYIKKSQ